MTTGYVRRVSRQDFGVILTLHMMLDDVAALLTSVSICLSNDKIEVFQ